MSNRKLLVKRLENGRLALHDAETGEVLSGQSKVEIVQEPGDITRCVVTFAAYCSYGVRLEIDD